MTKKICHILTLVAVCASVALGQSYRGSIHGTVTDKTGAALVGASVRVENPATGLKRDSITDTQGFFRVLELPAGEYQVTSAAAGFKDVSARISVAVGSDSSLKLIQPLAGVDTIEVNVNDAEYPLIEISRDVLGQVVEEKLLTELPINGRDFTKLVALVPGATVEPSGVAGTQSGFGQFNINGNRDRSNNYTLDGTDNNDPFFNNSALNQVGITGAPASLLPIDAIAEFNLQAQFGAEYGRNSGSVVNIVTKSGANHFHGSAFEFHRNSALDAHNYFNTSSKQTHFVNNNFGGALGGPIVRNKTFFFAAYEGQRERVGSDFNLLVPTTAQRDAARQIAQDNGVETINPALESILNFYPQSDTGVVASVVNDKNDMDSLIGKIDHNISQTEQLSGRYAFARSQQVFPLGSAGGFGKGSRLGRFSQTSPTRVQVASVSLLSTLGPHIVNELRFGYSRYKTSFSSLDANPNDAKNFVDPTALGLDFGTGKVGLPEFDFSVPIENLGAQGFSVPRGRTSQTYQLLDNLTWIHGKHTLKLGGEFRRAAIANFNDNLERSIINFFPNGYSDDPVVDALADFYLGGINGGVFTLALTGDTNRTTYNTGGSAFAQDDYRLAPNFTLNAGVRWEYFGPLTEKNNLLSNFNSGGVLTQVGTNGLNSAYQADKLNFGPRLGFAWNLRQPTVIRGSYGIYYDYVPQHLFIANFTSSAGLATNPGVTSKPVNALDFNSNAFNGAESGPVYSASQNPPNIFVTPLKFHTPYTQNWNVNLQQQLAGDRAALEVGYVGSKGTHLVRLYDQNQPDGNFNYPNPNYNNIATLAPIAASIYHGLQATVRVNGFHGLSGFTSYTWSKVLDDASDGIDFASQVAFPQDSTNLKAERGSASFDTRHRFTLALNYAVPQINALGKRWGSGWNLDSIITAQSGRPIPIITSNDTTNRFYFNQRPNVVAGVNPITAHWNPASGYLNQAAFTQPDDGTFGSLGRNAIFGPGYKNADFSLSKELDLYEGLKLQLRAEVFNIFNHPNFAQPNNSIVFGTDGNGQPIKNGLITQTPDVAQGNPGLGGGGPRVMQIGLKLKF